jgi:hypothetical protein
MKDFVELENPIPSLKKESRWGRNTVETIAWWLYERGIRRARERSDAVRALRHPPKIVSDQDEP